MTLLQPCRSYGSFRKVSDMNLVSFFYSFFIPGTAPVVEAPAPAPVGPEVSGAAAKSSNGGGDGLNTASIVAMSVGGALLLVGAALMRRRRMNGSSEISAMDATSIQPSGDEAA